MQSNYTKIYSGNHFTAERIKGKLEEVGITAIMKDESESARLAGFAANIGGEREVHVHSDELDRAMIIVRAISTQTED
jgi:hypothetical protein